MIHLVFRNELCNTFNQESDLKFSFQILHNKNLKKCLASVGHPYKSLRCLLSEMTNWNLKDATSERSNGLPMSRFIGKFNFFIVNFGKDSTSLISC